MDRDGPPSAGRDPTGSGLRVRVLGGFAVEVDAAVIPSGGFPRRKAQLLVKLLALQPGAALHRDLAIEALWPHLSPEAGAHQLHNAASQARSALRTITGASSEPLAIEHGILSLRHPGGVRTDADELRADAAAALADGEVERLQQALARYTGPLLPDDPYEIWAEGPRAEVAATVERLRLALAGALLAARRPVEAAAVLEAVLRDEPTDERAYRALMQAAADGGDTAGVERAFARCREALRRELDTEPSAETAALLSTLRGRIGAPRIEAALPQPTTPFVGRHFELAEVERVLATPGRRLLTLTGIGGIGKTRLALEAARRHVARTGAEVVVVELPEACSEEHLLTLLVDALSVPPAAQGPREHAVAAALASRSVLLVLDNAEHALAARPLLARLLASAAGLVVLAASRQRLELQGESVVEVHGLEVPRPEVETDLRRFGAVQLFMATVARTRGTSLGDGDAAAIGRICRILHGVPLALELAASWVGVLSCQEIQAELERGLDLLVSPTLDVPERHRSLRHAFEHTWRMLDAEERRHLARLSIFPAPCTVDTARQVTGIPLTALRALGGTSLVTQPTPGRCTIHPVVRQFAAEKLPAAEASELSAAHAAHYLARLDECAALLGSGTEREVIHDVVADLPHLRLAFGHATATGDTVGIAAGLHGLFVLYDKLGWHQEGATLLEAALAGLRSGAAQADPDGHGEEVACLVARLEARTASFLHALGRVDEAHVLLDRSRDVLARLGEAQELAFTLDKLGLVAHERGDDDTAEALLREALALRRTSGSGEAIATSLNNLGSMAYSRGDFAEAERLCREALALQRANGAGKGAVISIQNLASICLAKGELEAAESLLAEGLALARALGSGSLAALFLANLGRAAARRGDTARAADLLHQAVLSALEVGAASLAASVLPTLATVHRRRGDAPAAVALCMLALRAPVADREVRAQAEALLLQLAHDLDAVAMAQAQEWGATLRLTDVVTIGSGRAEAT